MKRIVIISVVLAFLLGNFVVAQQVLNTKVLPENPKLMPKEQGKFPTTNNKQEPPPYIAPANAAGISTNISGYYDYQSNGGSMDYLEMNPTNPNKVHAIMMISTDPTQQSPSRRTRYNFSSDGGTTWGPLPATVPSVRSGFPSMTLNPYLGIPGYPAVVANHADPDGDGALSSYLYFDASEGGRTFSEGYTPDPWDPVNPNDEPIWPHIAVSSNGNIIMAASRSTADDLGVVTYDTNGIFSTWYPIDTVDAAGGRYAVAIGPSGKVAIAWHRIGTGTRTDTVFYVVSTNNGQTWGPPQVAAGAHSSTKAIYWAGIDAIYLGNTLYIAYTAMPVADDGEFYYRSNRIELFNANNQTTHVVIDSNNFPLMMRTLPNDSAQANHGWPFTYPALGKNSTETRLYVACDAFLEGVYQSTPSGGWHYSDVIYTYTTDGGNTWADVKNVTKTSDLDERYVSVSTINPIISDSNWLYLAFQEDNIPGASAFGDGRPISLATLKFLKVNTDYKPQKDIVVTGVDLKNYTGIHAIGVPETVIVTIYNGGTESNPTSVPLTYKVGSAPTNSGDGTAQTFTGITWNGKFATLRFTQTVTPTASGEFKVFVKSFYPGDEDAESDLGSKTIDIAKEYDLAIWEVKQLNTIAPKAPPMPNIQVQVKVRNIGSYAHGPYTIRWSVRGTAQTPVGRGGLAYAQYDSVVLSFPVTERGTYFYRIWVDLPEDMVRANDSTIFYGRAYPAYAFSITYDDSDDLADSFWGRDTQDSAVCQAVRFTAPNDIKLMNIDAIYTSAASGVTYSDSIILYVWAAGTDTSPGAIIWKKKFSGDDYVTSTGRWISLPVGDGDGIQFAAGQDFWAGIQYSRRVTFPQGIDLLDEPIPYPPANPRVNASFFSEDSAKIANQANPLWMPMRDVLIHEPGGNIYAKNVIRAICVPSVPGGTFTVNNLWNMVSVPVQVTGPKSTLFPTAVSNAFKFIPGTGYQVETTLGPGTGYWLKFNAAQSVELYGSGIANISIPVVAGWNMIGSISTTVPVANVTVPGGAASSFYAYNGGYVVASTIQPGKAYWIKAGSGGNLVISATAKRNAEYREPDLSAFNKLIVKDKAGNKQTLYFGDNDGKFPVDFFELPPSPPEGMFDVRYASQRMLEAYPAEGNAEYGIRINSASYPVTIEYQLVSRTKSFALQIGDRKYTLNSENGSIKLDNPNIAAISLKVGAMENVPTEFNLTQNYPNPFNPSTKFEFAVPKTARVEIVVYDILGSKVATLFDGVKNAGYHSIEWNGTNSRGELVPSGVYFVKMTSDGFSSVKKAIMMK